MLKGTIRINKIRNCKQDNNKNRINYIDGYRYKSFFTSSFSVGFVVLLSASSAKKDSNNVATIEKTVIIVSDASLNSSYGNENATITDNATGINIKETILYREVFFVLS